MDRFERGIVQPKVSYLLFIYIPIWIDLKATEKAWYSERYADLHSNMDRFERSWQAVNGTADSDLHSNMDRFERCKLCPLFLTVNIFTFQYG